MGFKEDLTIEVREIFATKFETRKGNVVPEAEDISLGNDAVTFDEAAVLYADLADSTKLVKDFKDWFAAEVYKSYLHCASKIIRDLGGVITAFDGDRIMGVFLGDNKCTSAAKAALQINYAVLYIINPALKTFATPYTVNHSVGVDMSKLFVARTGIRGSNDLVWVGRAANYAAKLCAIREGDYASWITAAVYDRMNKSSKFGGNPEKSMWEKRSWTAMGIDVYRSNWHWAP